MAAQKTNRKALPPELTPNNCLVAFIDILGFGHEIERATTKSELQRCYDKVRLVQGEFQLPSAMEDPDDQAELSANYGRRVIALSDSIVVVIAPKSPSATAMGTYDHFGFAIYELLLAQALCVAKHGIFVRGGVSHGSFFFEHDVMLSPALARAYELESKYAKQPVIVVPEETRSAILNAQKNGSYAEGHDPTPGYFRRLDEQDWRNQPLYFLDYISLMLETEEEWTVEERQGYIEARKAGDHTKAQAALDRRAPKGAARFLKHHRKRIEKAFNDTDLRCVKQKYRWLMEYHNRSFHHDLEYLRDEVIDVSNFQLEET